MSSMVRFERPGAIIASPAAPAARAVDASPSAHIAPCGPVGAIMIGAATRSPSTVVVMSTRATSTSTRGRIASRSKARRFSASVTPSSAPADTKSQSGPGICSRASRS